uniref:Platelet-derived growth factor (PDGF) family profile domain-containing protein n=1 Tax=Anopheles atroparvus TaxID=41427 RepID=A0AAG5DQW4_ANOAO
MAANRVQWFTAVTALWLLLLVLGLMGFPGTQSQQRSADRTGAIIFPDEMSTRYEAVKEKRESPTLADSAEANPEDAEDDWSDQSIELPISYARQLAELNATADILALLDPDSIDQRIFMDGGEFSGRDIGVLPTPASCEPETQLVSLRPENLTGTRYYFYPTCTRVKRCSGCCNTNQLVCEPVANRTILYKVTILEYRNGKRDRFSHLELVPVEEHVRCKCQCRVKDSDCNELQVYNPNNCRCECTNKDDRTQCTQERQTKQWNPDTCSCDCIPRTEECTSGSHYDRSACKCIPQKPWPGRNWNQSLEARRRLIVKPMPVPN